MSKIRFPSSIRQVSRIEENGRFIVHENPDEELGRGEGLRLVQPLTRTLRALARSTSRASNEFLVQLDSSCDEHKRDDGWVPDFPEILFRSVRAAQKEIREALPKPLQSLLPR